MAGSTATATATATRSPLRIGTAPPEGRAHGSSSGRWYLLAGLIGVVAAVLRLVRVGPAYDLFVDERVYQQLGNSVRSGGFPRLPDDRLFLLHPPGFFYLESGWSHLWGSPTDLVAAIDLQRSLNAVLAGLSAVVLVVLLRRVAGPIPALGAAALFVLEPYILRQNGRVLLETAMMLLVLLGYLVLTSLTRADDSLDETRPSRIDETRPSTSGRHARTQGTSHPILRAAVGGTAFGLAVLTKDLALLITAGPLLVTLLFRWMPRRQALVALVATAVPYLLYVAVLAQQSHFAEFWKSKTVGASRLAGLLQTTGFNAPGAPKLTGQLLDQASTFGTTYILLVVGMPALLYVLIKGDATHRFLGSFHATAAAALAYAGLFGTLEEQFLYLLVLPNLLTLAMAASLLARRRRLPAVLRIGVAVVLAAALCLDVGNYVNGRIRPDDGYAQLRNFMATHVPAGSTVTVPNGGTELALNDRYRVGPWTTPGDLQANNVHYLVVPWKTVQQGYAYLGVDTVTRLADSGQKLFSFSGRTYGELALYELPPVPAAHS